MEREIKIKKTWAQSGYRYILDIQYGEMEITISTHEPAAYRDCGGLEVGIEPAAGFKPLFYIEATGVQREYSSGSVASLQMEEGKWAGSVSIAGGCMCFVCAWAEPVIQEIWHGNEYSSGVKISLGLYGEVTICVKEEDDNA